ncbi:MAG: hypothetical protein R3E01_32235 [Pirellulaceae bacterium]|nr:hypothetical protein [Planctomycetales bacterium]
MAIRLEQRSPSWSWVLVLGAVLAAGFVLTCDRRRSVENWIEVQPKQPPRLDLVMPAPLLGAIALVGLVAVSVLGCYVYYPPPSEILEELRIVNTEVATSSLTQDRDTALYWIPVYDDWTRKLQVSLYLRGESLTPYRRAKAQILRSKLESLEHGIQSKEDEDLRQLGLDVDQAFRRMRAAFLQQK